MYSRCCTIIQFQPRDQFISKLMQKLNLEDCKDEGDTPEPSPETSPQVGEYITDTKSESEEEIEDTWEDLLSDEVSIHQLES